MDFTWVDAIIFLIFFTCIALGVSRGFFKELISLTSIFIALIFTIKFTQPLYAYLNNPQGVQDVSFVLSKFFGIKTGNQIALMSLNISFLLLFVGVYCIGEAINFYASPNIIMFAGVALINRGLGAIIGYIRGLAFSLVLILALQLTPVTLSDGWSQSRLIPALSPKANYLGGLIMPGGFPRWQAENWR